MKKHLALILAAILLAASFASCAAPSGTAGAISPNVRLTSSDAGDAGAWLTARLGDRLTDSVVLGTSADGYGVDLSALEADGYIIRDLGGETALFAKTADGLDRAARRYAKTVEAGTPVADVTYHEGARIKKLTIAGRDISEYTIYAEDEASMKKGAAELSSLIEKACGVTLPVSTAEPDVPCIIMKYVHDESLSTCGYRWSVNGGGLTIEVSDLYTPTSPHFAVIRFLETRLGWLGLTFGYEALPECEFIAIEDGESGGETNAFTYVCPYGDQYSGSIGDAFDHSYGNHYGGFASTHLSGIPQCCHGMQSNKFGGELSTSDTRNWAADQPCYLDEEFYEVSLEDVENYIKRQLNSGKVIGEDFFFVDIAAGDNGYWCDCKDCRAMLKAEGSVAASVLTWANRLTETLDETYPGLKYGVFAYAGTNKPPKTVRPNDLLYITYCYDMSCDMHAHDGRDCTGEEPLFGVIKGRDNFTMAGYFEGWCDICPHVYVWFYGMDQGFTTLNYVDTIRDDIRYFHEHGAIGLFWEAEDYGFSLGKAAKWMMSEMAWNVDMTDEEYDAYLDRVLAAMYGDGAPYVRDYIAQTAAIQRSGACAHCWYSAISNPGVVPEPTARAFDALFALTEAAISGADSRRQEMRAVKLSANCIYQGCLSSYFDAYEAGDDERCAELVRRYGLIEERLGKFGISPRDLWRGGVSPAPIPYESDMEVMAWTNWRQNAAYFGITVPKRTLPDRVAQIILERNAGE